MKPKSRCYCSVPQCKSYATKGISLHKFPKDSVLTKKWAVVLRIGKPISKYMLVCSLHFEEKDFHPITPLKTKKLLKKNVIPSCNIPVRSHDDKKRNDKPKRLKNRLNYQHVRQLAASENNISVEAEMQLLPVTDNTPITDNAPIISSVLDILAEVCSDQLKLPSLSAEKAVQVDSLPSQNTHDAVYGILQSNRLLVAYTGISCDLFNCIVGCVEKTIESGGGNVQSVTDKLLLTLIKLKLNLSFRVLSGLFNKTETYLKRCFDVMVPVLSETLKCTIYVPKFEENIRSLPRCFNKYKKVRLILDCTEVPVQQPKCLKCKLRCYSHYKPRHTVKFLIGVNPAGIITYISPAYGGKVSDKAIFNNENIIDILEPYVDDIMVDKGFAIEKECLEAGINLIRPPFLRKANQLNKSQAEDTASIARARVHVERVIQRIKVFQIFSEKISWNLLSHIDDIAIILAAFVNLSNPILKDDKFN